MDLPSHNIAGKHWRGKLLKDGKLISDVEGSMIPFPLPESLNIHKFDVETIFPLSSLKYFELTPLGANPARIEEWKRFLSFLMHARKVAIVTCSGLELLINPPVDGVIHPKQKIIVSYRPCQKTYFTPQALYVPVEPVYNSIPTVENPAFPVGSLKEQIQTVKVEEMKCNNMDTSEKDSRISNVLPKYAQTHPSYLETLGQNHSSWIFGAVAELVDNARDAKATRVDITIEPEFFRLTNSEIPVLSVKDNGTGMDYSDILRMVSFGHKRPEADDNDIIGRFGVGFKTGAMRLGKDAVVFTQTRNARSIAFLSQSFNDKKETVEIPIITYEKSMEFDTRFHSLDEAESRLRALKHYSPFHEYNIGAKFAAFGEGTGTIVCVYNLDRWGSDYSLKWDPKNSETESNKNCDITIRSRRVRTRPSQMTKEVPLDYSLRAYLEVMFLEPKMKFYVQGTPVKARRLHKSLNKTQVYRHTLGGKEVELTLGRSQVERDRGNCGIFLYWHGRLIEAYKRVGAMIHSPDVGRGVIGVIDVTDIMRLGDGTVAVLNNKQGFADCEAYAMLDEWLGNMANQYWDENFDTLEMEGGKDVNATYTPDHSWVQCNKCLKWRMLDASFDEDDLPDEWFCYMRPFNGSCKMPETEADAGVVTVGAVRRSRGLATLVKEEVEHSTTAGKSSLSNKDSSDVSLEGDSNYVDVEVKSPSLRRPKRGASSSLTQAGKGRQKRGLTK